MKGKTISRPKCTYARTHASLWRENRQVAWLVLRLCDFMYKKLVRNFHQERALTRPSILTILCLKFLLMFQMSSASEHTSNISLLRSVFVENLDLLVVASEDNNICK